jgi:uncharacterized protein (UPF0248 family)
MKEEENKLRWHIYVWYRDKSDNLTVYTISYCCRVKAYEWIVQIRENQGLNCIVSEEEFKWVPIHRIVQVDCVAKESGE